MNNKKKKSFTLIELLVVIVIIGILAGVIMISTSSSIDKANIAKLKLFEESVANDLAANMVSRWKLDDVSGTSASDAWSSNTGTLSGFADTTAGYGDSNTSGWMSESNCISGTCLRFDGTNDYIGILSQPSLHPTTEYSITLWIKTGTLKEWSALIGTYTFDSNDYLIYQGGAGGTPIGVSFVDGIRKDVSSGLALVTGKWYYIAFTVKQKNSMRIYVDGVLKGTTSISSTGNITTNNDPIRIAGQGFGSPLWFDGSMDDIRIYNAAISSSQIKQNYIAGLDSLLSKGSISKENYNQRINALAYNKYE